MPTRFTLALAALSLLVAGQAFASTSSKIDAIAQPGGSSPWDVEVRSILLAAHDSDRSGALDTAVEVDSISCPTWRSIDKGVKSGWKYGVRAIYGFEADKIWIGNAIGFDERVRSHADGTIKRCTTAAPTSTPAARPAPSVSQQILAAAPGQGGQDAFDKATRRILLASFDANGSGSIDSTEELASVPCEVYAAIDTRVKEGWDYGVRVIYGFEADKIWVGYALGFDEAVRSGADVRMATCK